jgi:protein TonB
VQKQGLDPHLLFQRRWLLIMLIVSLAGHGFFILLPGFSSPEPESVQERIVVGFQPRQQSSAINPPAPPRPNVAPSPPPSTTAPALIRKTPQPARARATAAPATTPHIALPTEPSTTRLPLPNRQQQETTKASTVLVTRSTPATASATDAAPAENALHAPAPATPTVVASQTVAAVETPPAFLDNPHPIYPPLARQRGWEGDVLIKVSVDNQGKVVRADLKQSSGHRVLDKSALKQIRTWRFSPALKGNVGVAGEVTVPVHFRLRQS